MTSFTLKIPVIQPVNFLLNIKLFQRLLQSLNSWQRKHGFPVLCDVPKVFCWVTGIRRHCCRWYASSLFDSEKMAFCKWTWKWKIFLSLIEICQNEIRKGFRRPSGKAFEGGGEGKSRIVLKILHTWLAEISLVPPACK